MRFEIALFAYQRETHGASITVDAEPTVAGVLSALDAAGVRVSHCRLAVNESVANPGDSVPEGARVALIPPVSGG